MLEFKLLGWKNRRNAKKEITTARLVCSIQIDRSVRFFQVIGEVSLRKDTILNNIQVEHLIGIVSEQQALHYIKFSLKGRDTGLIDDVYRSTANNILLRRVILETEDIVLNYIQHHEFGNVVYRETEKLDSDYPISHDRIDRYSFYTGFDDLASIDTDSSLNGSNLSGDSRGEITANCEGELLALLGVEIPDEKSDEINDLMAEYYTEVYSDCVAFEKAVKLLTIIPYLKDEQKDDCLSNQLDIHIQKDCANIVKEYDLPSLENLWSRRSEYWFQTELYTRLYSLLF